MNSSQVTVVFPTPDAPYTHNTGSDIMAVSIGTATRPVDRIFGTGRSGGSGAFPGVAQGGRVQGGVDAQPADRLGLPAAGAVAYPGQGGQVAPRSGDQVGERTAGEVGGRN